MGAETLLEARGGLHATVAGPPLLREQLARPRGGEQKGRWRASRRPLAWRRLLEPSRRAGRVLVSPSPPWKDIPLSGLLTNFSHSGNGCSAPVCLQGAIRATAGRPALALPWALDKGPFLSEPQFPKWARLCAERRPPHSGLTPAPRSQTLQRRNPGSGRQCLARGHVAGPWWGGFEPGSVCALTVRSVALLTPCHHGLREGTQEARGNSGA